MALLLSIFALVIAIIYALYTISFIRSTQRKLRDLTEVARKVKAFNARLTRLHNYANNQILGMSGRIKRCEERIDKTIEFPKGKE